MPEASSSRQSEAHQESGLDVASREPRYPRWQRATSVLATLAMAGGAWLIGGRSEICSADALANTRSDRTLLYAYTNGLYSGQLSLETAAGLVDIDFNPKGNQAPNILERTIGQELCGMATVLEAVIPDELESRAIGALSSTLYDQSIPSGSGYTTYPMHEGEGGIPFNPTDTID